MSDPQRPSSKQCEPIHVDHRGAQGKPSGRAEPLTIAIIRREHESIAKALDAIAAAIASANDSDHRAVDLEAVGAMLAYLEAFPERLHHPREERQVFDPLVKRCSTVAEVLDPLRGEHESSGAMLGLLRRRLHSLSDTDQRGLQSFRRELAQFERAYRRHIRIEEDVVLPLAMHYLDAADWTASDAAFAANLDPLSGQALPAEFIAKLKNSLATIDAALGSAWREPRARKPVTG